MGFIKKSLHTTATYTVHLVMRNIDISQYLDTLSTFYEMRNGYTNIEYSTTGRGNNVL